MAVKKIFEQSVYQTFLVPKKGHFPFALFEHSKTKRNLWGAWCCFELCSALVLFVRSLTQCLACRSVSACWLELCKL